MRTLMMALIAVAQIALLVLALRAAIALTGDVLSAMLVVLILTIAFVSLFTTGAPPRRERASE